MWPRIGKKRREIWWWEPRWAYVPALRQEFWSVFGPKLFVRSTILASLIFAAIIIGCKIRFPFLQLGFLWKAPLAVGGLFLLLPFHFGILAAIPPFVSVRQKHISRMQGQTVWNVDAKFILAARLVVFAEDRVRLRIWYKYKSHRRTRTIGVSPKVNLDRLIETMPVKPTVRDARKHFARLTLRDHHPGHKG